MKLLPCREGVPRSGEITHGLQRDQDKMNPAGQQYNFLPLSYFPPNPNFIDNCKILDKRTLHARAAAAAAARIARGRMHAYNVL